MTTYPTTAPSLRTVVVVSYLLAVVNFGVNHLPWGWDRADRHLLIAINGVAGAVGTASFLLWCATAVYAFWRFRKTAWPVLIGAPFALATFAGVVLYVVAVTLSADG